MTSVEPTKSKIVIELEKIAGLTVWILALCMLTRFLVWLVR